VNIIPTLTLPKLPTNYLLLAGESQILESLDFNYLVMVKIESLVPITTLGNTLPASVAAKTTVALVILIRFRLRSLCDNEFLLIFKHRSSCLDHHEG